MIVAKNVYTIDLYRKNGEKYLQLAFYKTIYSMYK